MFLQRIARNSKNNAAKAAPLATAITTEAAAGAVTGLTDVSRDLTFFRYFLLTHKFSFVSPKIDPMLFSLSEILCSL